MPKPKSTTTTTFPPGAMSGPAGKKTPAEKFSAKVERANKKTIHKAGK